MNATIYITACSKREKYAKEIKKLFKEIKMDYYFVYGKDQQNKIEPYIEVDCVDVYENLPLKSYLIAQHFIKTDKDFLVKINDDTFLDIEKFEQLTVKADYTGLFVPYVSSKYNKLFHWFKVSDSSYKIEKRTFNLSYAQGSFYILSKKACNLIVSKGIDFFVNTPESYLGEDVKVGMCLEDSTITREDITHLLAPHYESAKDFLSIHPIHYILFSKLKNCRTTKEKQVFLAKFLSLNDNIARQDYLNKILL